MSGLALFSLKWPSLLAFEDVIRGDSARGQNLRTLFGIKQPASDTQMRDILDPINPGHIRKPFQKIFAELQSANVLQSYRYLDQGYLLALDGTGHYCSSRVKCPDCMEKKSRSGEVTYHHQLLGVSIVHPTHRQVIPLCPEAVSNKDGGSKQDCEFKAAQRWIEKFRKEHSGPPLKYWTPF